MVCICLLFAWLAAGWCVAGEEPSLAVIRDRIEAIGIRSVRSADGVLVVSGPDSFLNAILLARLGELRDRIQSVVGLPMPVDSRSVRVLVPPAGKTNDVITVAHRLAGGMTIHRVVLRDYADADSRAGLEAVCAAFLALYIHPDGGADGRAVPYAVPRWFVQGFPQVLADDARATTMDQAVQLWRDGQLPSPIQIVASKPLPQQPGDASSRLLVACGCMILWLADATRDEPALPALFRHLSGGHRVDAEWLRGHLASGGDLDEAWDRWLLSQRRVVRALGKLTLAHLEALRLAWRIRPGVDGIPGGLPLPPDADCLGLLQYRDQHWFAGAIRQKRYRIEMLALGRPAAFRQLTAAYVDVLNAIEAGGRPAALAGQAVAVRKRLQALHETVRQAGGVWSP